MLSIRKQVNVISTLKIQQVKTYEYLKHANERIRYYTKPKKSRKRLTGRTLGPPPASNQNHIPYCGLRAEKVISSFHGPAILNHGGWMTLKGLQPLHQNALCSWIRGERLALAESSTKTVTLWQRVTVTLTTCPKTATLLCAQSRLPLRVSGNRSTQASPYWCHLVAAAGRG